MTKLLIYREDSKVVVINKEISWILPVVDSTEVEEIKHIALEQLGFSIHTFGNKHGNILMARRVFGDQKEGTKWFSLEEASQLVGVSEAKLKKWVDEDIAYSTKRQLELIQKVFGEFDKEKVNIFLWGGWAVDFLVGHITRPHVDIDTLVWKKDKEKIRKIMENLGFSVQDKIRKFQNSYDGFQFDIDFVEPLGDEFISSQSPQTKGLKWSKDTFSKTVDAKLNGVQVRVINQKSLYSFTQSKIKYYTRKIGQASGPVEKTKQDLLTLEKYLDL